MTPPDNLDTEVIPVPEKFYIGLAEESRKIRNAEQTRENACAEKSKLIYELKKAVGASQAHSLTHDCKYLILKGRG